MAVPSPARRPRAARRRVPIEAEVEEGLMMIGFAARMQLKNRLIVDVLTMDGAVDPVSWTAEARRLLRSFVRQSTDAAGRIGQEAHVTRASSGRGESEHDYRAIDARNLRRRTLIQHRVADRLTEWEQDPEQVRVLVEEARRAGLEEISAAIRRLVVEERTATEDDERMLQERLDLVRTVDIPALGAAVSAAVPAERLRWIDRVRRPRPRGADAHTLGGVPLRYTCVLVDLDGTVMDSAPGITSTLAEVLVARGLLVPPPARMVGFVGPPILDGLRDIAGLDAEQSTRVLDAYRASYRLRGAFDAAPYEGVREALEALRAAGLPLAIATSKPESIATRILEHFGLDGLFTVIAGASDDETRSAKADVIARALELLTAAGVDVSRPVMIGDRSHDVEGAAEHGVPAILAAWGYGAPEEAAGTVAVADSPAGLPALILTPDLFVL